MFCEEKVEVGGDLKVALVPGDDVDGVASFVDKAAVIGAIAERGCLMSLEEEVVAEGLGCLAAQIVGSKGDGGDEGWFGGVDEGVGGGDAGVGGPILSCSGEVGLDDVRGKKGPDSVVDEDKRGWGAERF